MKFIQTNQSNEVIYEMHVYDSLAEEEKASIGSGYEVEEIPNAPSTERQYKKFFTLDEGFWFEEVLPEKTRYELENEVETLKLMVAELGLMVGGGL